MTVDPLHSRQARLVEVGAEGQARLDAARASVGPGSAGRVEARYLAGAGVTVEAAAGPSRNAPPPAWLADLHPGAREVAEGALAALDFVRATLGPPDEPRA